MREVKEQDNRHITREMFDSWQQGGMDSRQEEAFLQHIGSCTFCAEQFAVFMEENLTEPPAYLEEEIIKRTKQLDVQAAVKVKQTSKQMQLMMYSLRVGLGVAASIFLLTVTGDVQKMNIEVSHRAPEQTTEYQKQAGITDKLREGSNYITDKLNQMTSGLFQIERESSKD